MKTENNLHTSLAVNENNQSSMTMDGTTPESAIVIDDSDDESSSTTMTMDGITLESAIVIDDSDDDESTNAILPKTNLYTTLQTKESPETTAVTVLVYPFPGDVWEIETAALGFPEAAANPNGETGLVKVEPKGRIAINNKDYDLLTEDESWWNDSLVDFWMQWYVWPCKRPSAS